MLVCRGAFLTQHELRVYRFIEKFHRENKEWPSIKEISVDLGLN